MSCQLLVLTWPICSRVTTPNAPGPTSCWVTISSCGEPPAARSAGPTSWRTGCAITIFRLSNPRVGFDAQSQRFDGAPVDPSTRNNLICLPLITMLSRRSPTANLPPDNLPIGYAHGRCGAGHRDSSKENPHVPADGAMQDDAARGVSRYQLIPGRPTAFRAVFSSPASSCVQCVQHARVGRYGRTW